MRRRIVALAVGVAALALGLFGVPLAVVAARLFRDEEHVRLQRTAMVASAEVPLDFPNSQEAIELPPVVGARTLGVYDSQGHLIVGHGPVQADAAVMSAVRSGVIADDLGRDQVTTAVPVLRDETVAAVVRAESPSSVLSSRRNRAWGAMVALGATVLAGTGTVAFVLAGRLGRPLADLAGAAHRLGGGDFTARAPRTELAEVDEVAAALNVTAGRLGTLVERERAFSSDASHQLRTPLAGLRLRLEVALSEDDESIRSAAIGALDDVERLEKTIRDLLSLARDQHADRGIVEVAVLVERLKSSSQDRLSSDGRRLDFHEERDLPPVRASTVALGQALDVLVANAVVHGGGAVTVSFHASGGGLAIDVSDEGPGLDEADTQDLFTRSDVGADGHGIGLSLAAALVQAEGGRLTLLAPGPSPTFRILLPESDGQE